MSFRAADLYPASGSTFIVDAVGPIDPATGKPAPTTVTFASNGASGTPLSAGGTLLVDATDIVQGGTVRAPSGTIVFGVGDPSNAATQAQFAGQPLVATDSVTFVNGSTTSVSNGGLVIPYGTTVDGVEWQFSPTTGATAPDLTAPPAKYIGVNGSRVALDKGAKIDLRAAATRRRSSGCRVRVVRATCCRNTTSAMRTTPPARRYRSIRGDECLCDRAGRAIAGGSLRSGVRAFRCSRRRTVRRSARRYRSVWVKPA